VARSLADVSAAGLSADSRFIMAYDAARTLSLGARIDFVAESMNPREISHSIRSPLQIRRLVS